MKQVKNFFKFCWCEIMGILVVFTALFFGVTLFFAFLGVPRIWMILLTSVTLLVVTIVVAYKKNKNYFEQLYTIVCMNYKIRDEYKNYVEIKDIILKYRFDGKVDVKRNIAVVQAAIERDKAYSIFWSALLTVFGVLLGAGYGDNSLLSMEISMMYLILILMYMEVGRVIPRNSFIKKVLDSIVVN